MKQQKKPTLNSPPFQAYVNFFTDGLRVEFPQLTVQLVMPGLVATNMGKTDRRAFNVPTAEQFASAAMRTVGRAPRTHGYWAHALEAVAIRAMPAWFFNYFIFKLAALKKAENLAYDAAHASGEKKQD